MVKNVCECVAIVVLQWSAQSMLLDILGSVWIYDAHGIIAQVVFWPDVLWNSPFVADVKYVNK